MAKGGGGTRNYRPGTSTHQKRLNEYESLMSSGYDRERSYFSKRGGFKATHKDHFPPKDKDYAEKRCDVLADKGYKVYLDSERSVEFKEKTKDGRMILIDGNHTAVIKKFNGEKKIKVTIFKFKE